MVIQVRDDLPDLFSPMFWTVSSVNVGTALVVTPGVALMADTCIDHHVCRAILDKRRTSS